MARTSCPRPLRRRYLPGSTKSRDHRARPDRRPDRDDAANRGSARRTLGGRSAAPRTEARNLSAGEKIPYATFDDAPGYPVAGWHWTPEGNAVVAKKYPPRQAASAPPLSAR